MTDTTKKALLDYFEGFAMSETDDCITVNGIDYPYFISMDEETPDALCCRVIIDGESYYFG